MSSNELHFKSTKSIKYSYIKYKDLTNLNIIPIICLYKQYTSLIINLTSL